MKVNNRHNHKMLLRKTIALSITWTDEAQLNNEHKKKEEKKRTSKKMFIRTPGHTHSLHRLGKFRSC